MSQPNPLPHDLLASVLERFQGVRRCGSEYEALCPVHEDSHPSLTIGPGRKGVVLTCQRGCTTPTVLAAVGLQWRDLFYDTPGNAPQALPPRPIAPTKPMKRETKGKAVAWYDYRDETGQLLYQVVRFEPKDFRQRTPKEGGGWTWSTKGVRRVPFHLPELREAVAAGRLVMVLEGEKDVITAEAHGFAATCNAGGAEKEGSGSKWRPELNEHFRGARVVILPDNDEAGWAHAQNVAAQLHQVAAEVRIVELPLGPRLPKHGKDVSDWFAAGNTADELKELVRRTPRWNPPEPPREAFAAGEYLTDYGNCRRLVRLHGHDLRYVPPWDQWLVWDNSRWAQDETAEVMRRAKQTALSIFREAADGRNAEAIGKHAIKSQSEARIRAMVSLAKSEPEVPVLPAQLDTHDWLLNVRNGTIDLRTGQLMPHRREDLHTKLAPVDFDPSATCPLWERFLSRVMDGNEELIGFLRRAVGYSLTGSTREQVLFLLYGTGQNGKSKFLGTLATLLGDYAETAESSTFLQKTQDSVRNDIAKLFGARFVTAIEADEGRHLAEALVKQVTGEDKMVARKLYQDYFEFTPAFKIFLAANHKPVIKGGDLGIWRRIRLIPFTVTIPPAERDLELGAKLEAELPGILNWALAGCLEWQRDGLNPPSAVTAATAQYQEEMDPIGSFLADQCVLHPTATVSAKVLWDAYNEWCTVAGEGSLKSQTAFGRKLRERGLVKDRTRAGYVYIGLRLVNSVNGSAPFSGNSGTSSFHEATSTETVHNHTHRTQEVPSDLRSLFPEEDS